MTRVFAVPIDEAFRGPPGPPGEPFNVSVSGLKADRPAFVADAFPLSYLADDTGELSVKRATEWGPWFQFRGRDGKDAFEVWKAETAQPDAVFADYLEAIKGPAGDNGPSAYQVWLAQGNVGPEAEFFESLRGEPGPDNYQVWLDAGNAGTREDFLATLVGISGPSAYEVWESQPANEGKTEAEFLESLGGIPGQSAYQVWAAQPGNEGKTEAEFFESLQGPPGEGEPGPEGQDGLSYSPDAAGTLAERGVYDGAEPPFVYHVLDESLPEHDQLFYKRSAAPGDWSDPYPRSAPGTEGPSAYDVWVLAGNSGTEADFFASLKGPPGIQGSAGKTLYSGVGAPAGTLGSAGDHYMEKDASGKAAAFYGPKASSGWGGRIPVGGSQDATEETAGLVEHSTAEELASGTPGNLVATVERLKAYLDGRLATEAVKTPVLLGNWVNFGSPWETAGFWKDPFGMVRLRGMVKSGTAGSTIFTLPDGYRPAKGERFPLVGGGYTIPVVDILVDGSVVAVSATNTNSLTLSGISFRAAPGSVVHRLSGATTEEGFTVAAKTTNTKSARLRVSASSDLSSPVYSEPVSPDPYGTLKAEIEGLAAGTVYYYGWELDGLNVSTGTGTCKTHASGAHSFSFAFGSCGDITDATGTAYDRIAALAPAFMLHLGDINYADLGENGLSDAGSYRASWEATLSKTRLKSMLGTVPLTYTWSDHDYVGDNFPGAIPGRTAARQTYRQYFPHHPLAESGAIYHSFEVGRVLFIVLDTKSVRTDPLATDNAQKTMLGATQKAWLKALLTANPTRPKVLCSDTTWNANGPESNADHWGVYQTEQNELVAHLAANNVENLVVLTGDAHMAAGGDGTGSPGNLPNFAAAPLEHRAIVWGGPWQRGPIPATSSAPGSSYIQQFGWVDVADVGGSTVTLTFNARNAAGTALFAPLSVTMDVS